MPLLNTSVAFALSTSLSTSLSMGLSGAVASPGDPVGIADAHVDMDLGPRQVSVDGHRWAQLTAVANADEPTVPPPGPWAAHRRVEIDRSDAGVRIRARWSLESREAGWWSGPLIRSGTLPGLRVESVRFEGKSIGIHNTPAGEEAALFMGSKARGELELVAFIPAANLASGVDGPLSLWLMPAVRGDLQLRGPRAGPRDRVPELSAGGEARRLIDGRFWAAEADLTLRWVAAARDDDAIEGPLAVAQSAVGLTFGDAEVRGRARVSWLLRRGELARVSIDTRGLGRDLEVAGPNVLEWTRNGERIDVELREPAKGRVDVDLRWSVAVPNGGEAKLAAPSLRPQQSYRQERFLQVARDGELEILPRAQGWSAVARAELPDWASGFIEGTPTASFRAEGPSASASFDVLRFVPVSGPPVVVDVAAYEVATTDEGRSLVQARYDVRNERASHLALRLPAGARMLGVRVNGETVTPSRDVQGSEELWRIPIVRSLESVKGTLSFPVEVIFIGEGAAWDKKETRKLALPALDAPVAVSRVRVYLPPAYDNRVEMGDYHRVEDFSEGEGITYGLGVAAGAEEVGKADELYRQALSGWMANDFQSAQASLDELSRLGASNANIDGLQANLDLVNGRGEAAASAEAGGQSSVVSRRIKDQAKMRAQQDVLVLDKVAKEAERAEAEGRYDDAEKKLEEAQQIGERLALLEQSESQEQISYNRSLSSSSARVAEKKKRKVSREVDARGRKRRKSKKGKASKALSVSAPKYVLDGANVSDESTGVAAGDEVSVYEFEDDDIEGELVRPNGANLEVTNLAPPEEPPMPALPPPAVKASPGVVITTEEAKQVPVGSDTSRDFTAVVDMAPTASPDSAGISLAGTTAAESQPSPPQARRAGGMARSLFTKRPKRSRRRGGGRKNKEAAAPAPAAPADAPAAMPTLADPNAALAGPVATASAVSVHIPAVGQAVLYQHMLLPEGQALEVRLEARRQKRSKRKR